MITNTQAPTATATYMSEAKETSVPAAVTTLKVTITPKPNTTPVTAALSTLTVTATPKPNTTPASTQMQTPTSQLSPTPILISTDALKATPTPLVMVPFVEDDGAASQDALATKWLGATAVLMVLVLATGMGAMLYRRYTAQSSEDDEADDGVSEADETTDSPSDDHDDDVPPSDEEYEVLRYDPPLNR